MGPDLLPDLLYISPLLLTFSPEPDQLNPLSVSFMAGEPITTWLPLIMTVIFSIIFIAAAIWRFNRQEF
jgi:ABC-type transport system involved in multi-copper enzyme maturation permease subunit